MSAVAVKYFDTLAFVNVKDEIRFEHLATKKDLQATELILNNDI